MPLKSTIIALFVVIAGESAAAQNLVANPGFEIHGQTCPGCVDWRHYSAFMQGWNDLGWTSPIFSTEREFDSDEKRRGYTKEKYAPHSGTATVSVRINLMDVRGPAVGGGSSGYLFRALQQPLQEKEHYSVKLWIRIVDQPGRKKAVDYTFLQHFGVNFTNTKPRITNEPANPYGIDSDTPFLLDTVVFGQWVQLNYVIRPTQSLSYITIGWFENPYDPVWHANKYGAPWFEYLVDDVEVVKLQNLSTADSIRAIDYPFKNLPKKIVIVPRPLWEVTAYFDLGKSTLTDAGKSSLDSLAASIRKDSIPFLVNIAGYADSSGESSSNRTLSLQRCESVKAYLVTAQKLPATQFEIAAFGDSNPAEDKATEAGRQANRRVVVTKSTHPLSMKWYQIASDAALDGQSDTAFYYLKIWLTCKETDKILLLFDTDLSNLHKDTRWKAVEYFVKNSYKKYKKPDLAYQLDYLYCQDQGVRGLHRAYEAAKGYIPEAMDLSVPEFIAQTNKDVPAPVMSANLEILKMEGWPSPADVGTRAAKAPVFILLHTSDTLLQRSYLPMVESAWKAGKIEPILYACYVDRVMLHEKGIQRYGTQYDPTSEDPTKFRLSPLESVEKINDVREDIGLPPKDLEFDEFGLIERLGKRKKKP